MFLLITTLSNIARAIRIPSEKNFRHLGDSILVDFYPGSASGMYSRRQLFPTFMREDGEKMRLEDLKEVSENFLRRYPDR